MDTIIKENSVEPSFQAVPKTLPTAFFSPSHNQTIPVGRYLPIKRAIDLIAAFVLTLTVLSWLYPIMFLLIRLSSRGNAIFIQKRIGKNGKVFNCYKFRTMYVNNDADTREAQLNDKRITRIGKWLRNTYIDELPQLINVLMGDMSLIGPRPHMLHHHYEFCARIPSYDRRHIVKPGITGLSQAKGYHGSMHHSYGIHGRTRLDLFYLKKMSLKLDTIILIKTALTILQFDKRRK
jgi:putative colanic acid biosynthesis UDP-glucose lipid carrier transferase